MSTIAVLRPKFWLPRFEPWRLLRPLKLEGQFSPGQRMQFEGAGDGEMHSGAVVGGGASLSFLQTAIDTSAASAYTFSGENLGAADAGRYIVCCYGASVAFA